MKKKTRRQKRISFPRLLLRGAIAAAALVAALAFGLNEYIIYQIREQSERQIVEEQSTMQKNISRINANENLTHEAKMNMISNQMSLYTWYDIEIDPSGMGGRLAAQVTPAYSPRGFAAAALIDDNDNMAASNKLSIRTVVRLAQDGSDPANGFYIFSDKLRDNPGAGKLLDDMNEFTERMGTNGDIEVTFDSIYYNSSTREFLPHEGKITLKRARNTRELIYSDEDMTVEEERDIHITPADEGSYKFIENPKNTDVYPRFSFRIVAGVTENDFAKCSSDFQYYLNVDGDSILNEHYADDDIRFEVRSSCAVYIDDKPYQMIIRYLVDDKDPRFMSFYYTWLAIGSGVIVLIIILLCWRKNVLNKARYAFEDYQRDLTNHLAHDIKTPLMAIGGYAENIMKGWLTEEEQKQYLESILANVSFTDSIITRTLYLNGMEDVKKLRKEQLKAESVIEGAFRKYALLLEERHITYSSEGSAEIAAERESFETAVENLISNAVKYTPDGGTIKATIDKKKITLANTVAEKIDTKDLMQPFVRGDETRSNTKSCGLGLSIAERAAEANGHRLRISCSDSEFTSEIIF